MKLSQFFDMLASTSALINRISDEEVRNDLMEELENIRYYTRPINLLDDIPPSLVERENKLRDETLYFIGRRA